MEVPKNLPPGGKPAKDFVENWEISNQTQIASRGPETPPEMFWKTAILLDSQFELIENPASSSYFCGLVCAA
jgi:hypothetical protein